MLSFWMLAADGVGMSYTAVQFKLSQQVPDETAKKTGCSAAAAPALYPESSLVSQQSPVRSWARQAWGTAWVHTNE